MSDSPEPTNAPEPEGFRSIFEGEPEAPDQDAITSSGEPGMQRGVTEDGHLKVRAATDGIDPFDHSTEQDLVDKQQKEQGTAPPPLPEDETIPVNNPAMMIDANEQLKEEMERRFRVDIGDMTVEVSSTDRDAFVRAALRDEELVFPIELAGLGVTIDVAMPSDEFTNSASAAVTEWGRKGHIDKESDLQWMLAFQQMHVWCQIRSVDGSAPAWSDYWADGMPKIADMRAFMRDPSNFEAIIGMNATRWRMLLDAIRIAEMKYRICLQNWRNRSFFTGEGTD